MNIHYDKIKSVPENLSDINPVPSIQVDESLLSEILNILSTAYTLSHFADDFKEEMVDFCNIQTKGKKAVFQWNFTEDITGADVYHINTPKEKHFMAINGLKKYYEKEFNSYKWISK